MLLANSERQQCECSAQDNWRLGGLARARASLSPAADNGKAISCVCTGSVSMFWEAAFVPPRGAQGWYWRHRADDNDQQLLSLMHGWCGWLLCWLNSMQNHLLITAQESVCIIYVCAHSRFSTLQRERERRLTMRWPSAEPFRLCPSNAKRRRTVCACDLYASICGFALHYICAGRTQSVFA